MKKQFLGYFVANFISKAIGFYSTIYATKYVLPETYGMIYYYISLASFISAISMIGMPGLILTNYITLDKNHQEHLRRQIYSWLILTSVILFVILLIYQTFNFNTILFLLFIFVMSSMFSHLEINLLRIHNNIKSLINITILSSVISLLLVLLFVKNNPNILLLVAILQPFMYMVHFFYMNYKQKFDFFTFELPTKIEFKVSIPMMLISFVVLGYYLINKQYILMFLDKKILGIYEMAFKFGSLVDILFMVVINTILGPILLNKLKINEVYGKNLILRLSLLSVFFGFIVFVIPDIIWKIPNYFINETYHEVYKYIKFIIFNVFVFQSLNFVNTYFMFKQKTNIMLYVWIFILIFNSLLGYFFIKSFSLYGLLISNNIVLILAYILFVFLLLKKGETIK